MSHRSADFADLLKSAEKLIRDLMVVPDEYAVLFMHGGGTGQMAAIPQNLQYLSANSTNPTASYLVTGAWSDKAFKEAQKFLTVERVIPATKAFSTIPPVEEWSLSPDSAYLYYCANETINGIEFQEAPSVTGNLVADISSSILSRPFDITKHSMAIAGTQKNLGIAGLGIAVVKKDLIGHAHPLTPAILDYNDVYKNNSLLNTPPCFSIYVTKLMLEWIRDIGGTEAIFERNRAKSSLIYNLIDSSNDFYVSTVDAKYRSQMNIPFRIKGGDEALEAEFIKMSQARRMISLKGHRSVGGIRVSLYNAVTLEETQALADLMKEFKEIKA